MDDKYFKLPDLLEVQSQLELWLFESQKYYEFATQKYVEFRELEIEKTI